MKFLITVAIVFVLLVPSLVFAESQTLPTDKGTLDIKLSYDKIVSGEQTKLNIDFLNPQTQKIQEHVDWSVTVSKDGETIFGPIPLTHTSVGSVKIPIDFSEQEVYSVNIEIEGILFQVIPKETVSFEIPVGETNMPSNIPTWIKNNAGWWADGSIDDDSFVQGIQYLIKEDILKIPPTSQGSGSGSNEIPTWIKSNAGWWADGSIDDDSFVQGIQYLIKEGIIKIN